MRAWNSLLTLLKYYTLGGCEIVDVSLWIERRSPLQREEGQDECDAYRSYRTLTVTLIRLA